MRYKFPRDRCPVDNLSFGDRIEIPIKFVMSIDEKISLRVDMKQTFV